MVPYGRPLTVINKGRLEGETVKPLFLLRDCVQSERTSLGKVPLPQSEQVIGYSPQPSATARRRRDGW